MVLFILAQLSLLAVVCLRLSAAQSQKTDVIINIGAVLSSTESIDFFREGVREINSMRNALPKGVKLNATAIVMNDNPIRAAQLICETIIPRGVHVVVASHVVVSSDSMHTGGTTSPLAVSYTCGFYKIPVIGISARDSIFSDKAVHSSFMRTVVPYSEQAEAWLDLVEYFKFDLVIFIHSSNQEGRAMLSRFQSKAADNTHSIKVDKNIQYTAGQENFTEELMELAHLQSRVVLLYATAEDAKHIFQDAKRLKLMDQEYVWIVTEQALHVQKVPVGVLGLKLDFADDEEKHIDDCLRLISKAVKAYYTKENMTEQPAVPNSCETTTVWKEGPLMLNYLKEQKFDDGETGRVSFNDVGDRLGAVYQIVNKIPGGEQVVGEYGKSDTPGVKLNMNESKKIIWPGGGSVKPKGITISTHLKVVTIGELPFVYPKKIHSKDECVFEGNYVPCPRTNPTTKEVEEFCCYGYIIDLLIELGNRTNITYDLHLVGDQKFGDKVKMNGTERWNGMVGEILYKEADMIVAPLTINPERAAVIDFTKPFMYQGLTILVKKTVKDSSLASFLQPFQDTLWILVGLSVHVVALVLYLLDRFSPFGRFKLAKSDDTEEDALNLSSAMWFAWGVLLNSGIGEGTPRSFSARVLGMVWAGFAMIIVASYTANLAAFLVLDRPVAAISGIDDARLRNPQDNFNFATVKNSAVAMYFKRQVELANMYRQMETFHYETAEEAIREVKIGKLEAFIWDSSRLKYEDANDCDLVTAGELFGRSGYGIGLNKGSPWTQDMSLAILNLHESGFMEELDGKWILVKDTKCPESENSPATLGLTNMAGVFMMVAGGIVTGVILIFIEIAYKKHRGLKEKELELAKTAADRWRGNIEKRRTLRRTLLQQQQERNKVTNGTMDSPARTRLPTYSPARGPSGYQPVATSYKSTDLPI